MSTPVPGGTLTLADDLALSRMGYGAMQLAGPGVWGPPRDPAEAVAVLREAVERASPISTPATTTGRTRSTN